MDNRTLGSELDNSFIQRGGSCVLASYAIVNKCFASNPIEETFLDYCRHFHLPAQEWREAEQHYAAHFHNEWKNRRKCKGYEVILDLHENSEAASFRVGRSKFDAAFYIEAAPKLAELERILRSHAALLNITYKPIGDFHSVTVFATPGGFSLRDTTRPGLMSITALSDLGKLQDAVLYVKK